MKDLIKNFLQKTLGYNNYLFYFSRFAITRVKMNRYEKEFGCFLDMLSKNDNVLDIGANIGITTVPIAQKCSKGLVYAFEPMPSNLKALKKIVQHYKLNNVIVYENALGDETGSIQMVLPVLNNNKMQGLSHVVEENGADEGEIFIVPVERLDDMGNLFKNKISAIKIDVEGFEYEVLKGGTKLLQLHKPVIYCELWNNEKRSRCLDYLNSLGYTTKVFENDKLIDFSNQEVTNFLFV